MRQHEWVTADGATRPETRYATLGEEWIAYQVVGDGPIDLVLSCLHKGLTASRYVHLFDRQRIRRGCRRQWPRL
jgi:hypothetical protein